MVIRILQSFEGSFKIPLLGILDRLNKPRKKPVKTHDFRKYRQGADFFIDFYDSHNSAKMVTSIFIKPGEKIILQDKKLTITYLTEAVEYYSNSNAIQEVSLRMIEKSQAG